MKAYWSDDHYDRDETLGETSGPEAFYPEWDGPLGEGEPCTGPGAGDACPPSPSPGAPPLLEVLVGAYYARSLRLVEGSTAGSSPAATGPGCAVCGGPNPDGSGCEWCPGVAA